MATITYDNLVSWLQDPDVAAVRFNAELQPVAGEGTRIYPPTYPVADRSSPYLYEKRLRNGEVADVVILDQVPSHANRVETALLQAWEDNQIEMPMLRLSMENPRVTIYGSQAPHRIYDAYWRDSQINGTDFAKTDLGKAVKDARLDNATSVLRVDPGSLVFGAWNSYIKGPQAKFPRIYSGEIIGWEPVEGARKAMRRDPPNLQGSMKAADAKAGDDSWTYIAAQSQKGTKLSEIGHGHIMSQGNPHGGATVAYAERIATLSVTALRRIRFRDFSPSQRDAAWAYLAAFVLLGDRLAYDSASLWLRSGCDLTAERSSIGLVKRGGVFEEYSLNIDDARELYRAALEQAKTVDVGLQLEPVDLTPQENLEAAIKSSFKMTESDNE